MLEITFSVPRGHLSSFGGFLNNLEKALEKPSISKILKASIKLETNNNISKMLDNTLDSKLSI